MSNLQTPEEQAMTVTVKVSPVIRLQTFTATFDGDTTIGSISAQIAAEIRRRYGYLVKDASSDVLDFAYQEDVTITRPTGQVVVSDILRVSKDKRP